MRASIIVCLMLSAAAITACSSGSPAPSASPASPTPTVTQPGTGTSGAGIAGTWMGTAADSIGAVNSGTALGISMGPGMGGGMMGSVGNMTWVITQTGSSFTGTVGFGGFQYAARMTMTGSFSGNGGTFTITMPSNSMPMGTCSGTATGTFTIDPATGQMRGTYSGQLTLVKG